MTGLRRSSAGSNKDVSFRKGGGTASLGPIPPFAGRLFRRPWSKLRSCRREFLARPGYYDRTPRWRPFGFVIDLRPHRS